MFTGLIKAIGEVGNISRRGADFRLTIIAGDLPWREFDAGESISVNGVCLTAVELLDDGFRTDVSTETLDVTALRDVSTGDRVNLEPSLAVGDRLGGHLVSGHVDCVARIIARETDGRSVRLRIETPKEYMRYIARKGSVCVDGVSLTVNEVSESEFGVNIIPHTADATIIGHYRVGTLVNIEVDMLARYIERLLSTGDDSGITKDFLRAHGYA